MNPIAIAVATSLGSAMVVVAAGVSQRRAERVGPLELVEVLERLASEVRSGASPRQALAEVGSEGTGTVSADLRRLHHRVELGMPLADTIGLWPQLRPGVVEIRSAASALALAVESGGSTAKAIDEVADSVRARAELEAEVQALAAQARASALVIAALPAAFMLVGAGADPGLITGLVSSTFGLLCLVSGLALYGMGWMWMMRITARVTA